MKSSYDTFRLNNGYEIPCVGFGTWQTPDGETAEMAVSEAIKAGCRHIDTAACYCRTSLIYTSPDIFWYNRHIDIVTSMEVLYHEWTQP